MEVKNIQKAIDQSDRTIYHLTNNDYWDMQPYFNSAKSDAVKSHNSFNWKQTATRGSGYGLFISGSALFTAGIALGATMVGAAIGFGMIATGLVMMITGLVMLIKTNKSTKNNQNNNPTFFSNSNYILESCNNDGDPNLNTPLLN